MQLSIRGQEFAIDLSAGKKQIVVEAESILEGAVWKGAFSAKSENLLFPTPCLAFSSLHHSHPM